MKNTDIFFNGLNACHKLAMPSMQKECSEIWRSVLDAISKTDTSFLIHNNSCYAVCTNATAKSVLYTGSIQYSIQYRMDFYGFLMIVPQIAKLLRFLLQVQDEFDMCVLEGPCWCRRRPLQGAASGCCLRMLLLEWCVRFGAGM